MEIKKGQTVRIKKGSLIRNTKDGYNNPKIAKKSYTVKVFDVVEAPAPVVGILTKDGPKEGFYYHKGDREKFNKWLDSCGLTLLEEALEKYPERFKFFGAQNSSILWITGSPRVEWVGAGRYWHWTEIDNVEIVE